MNNPARLDELTAGVLRVRPEACAYVEEADVHAQLTDDPAEYVAVLEEQLWDIAAGRVGVELPPKAMFADAAGPGGFCVMPCVLRRGGRVTKTVTILGTDRTRGAASEELTIGKALRLHPDENSVTHIFEASLLFAARTAACATLAVKHLTQLEQRRRVTLIGAGRVAYYFARYLATIGGVEQLIVRDAQPARATLLAASLQQELEPTVRCDAASAGPPEACDVVVYATISAVPVCAAGDVQAGLVVSLGADAPQQRELDVSWAAAADVYVDTAESIEAGDLREWTARGAVSRGEVTDLLTLIRHGPKSPQRRQAVFIATGSALFDHLTIGYLLGRNSHRPQ